MAAVSLSCPSCKKLLPTDRAVTGGQISCPQCGLSVALPSTFPNDGMWYYARDNQKHGPFPLTELRRLAAGGQLRATDMVLQVGANRWASPASLPGLFPAPTDESVSEPFDQTPPPRLKGVLGVRGMKGIGQAVVRTGRWLLSEGREVCIATYEQTARLTSLGLAVWRSRSLAQRARLARRNLGQKMYQARVGSDQTRGEIAAVEERIQSAEASRASTKTLKREREQLLLCMADTATRSSTASVVSGPEFDDALRASTILQKHEEQMRCQRKALPPQGNSNWVRVIVGYGLTTTLLLIAALSLPSRSTRQPEGLLASTGSPGDQGSRPDPDTEITLDDLAVAKGEEPSIRYGEAVDALGNSRFKAEIHFSPVDYAGFKRKMSLGLTDRPFSVPNIRSVIRYLNPEASSDLLEEVVGSWNDATTSITLTGRILGRARTRDREWVIELSPDASDSYRIAEVHGSVVRLEAQRQPGAVSMALKMILPREAERIRLDDKKQRLLYSASPSSSPLRFSMHSPGWSLSVKPHLLSALHKLYADPKHDHLWAGRSIFHNTTNETLKDYRVRFRLRSYSEWSNWYRTDAVFLGQTVVDVFRPVIDPKVNQLRDPTPVDVEAEYSYKRPNGEVVSDSHSERTRLLGINEGVYSDIPQTDDITWFEVFKHAPLVLASFSTPRDPVLLDLVGAVNRAAGAGQPNAPTPQGDIDALKFMEALYNLFRANINYESTGGGVESDGLLHQHLKYGRDVLRSRSGTCINLAILYASIAEAAGLEAHIIVIRGHAFPAVLLPHSGLPIFVETTGCGDGTVKGSGDFLKACKYARDNYRKAATDGRLMEVNLKDMHSRGVHPPQLPDIPGNPLREWRIEMPSQTVIPSMMDQSRLNYFLRTYHSESQPSSR